MSKVESKRELMNEEMNMGVGDIVGGAKAVVAGQVKTGLGLIAEGLNDIKGRS